MEEESGLEWKRVDWNWIGNNRKERKREGERVCCASLRRFVMVMVAKFLSLFLSLWSCCCFCCFCCLLLARRAFFTWPAACALVIGNSCERAHICCTYKHTLVCATLHRLVCNARLCVLASLSAGVAAAAAC